MRKSNWKVKFLKISTFSRVLLKDFVTERNTPCSDTCPKFIAIFCKIARVFIGKKTSNQFLEVTKKETRTCGTIV